MTLIHRSIGCRSVAADGARPAAPAAPPWVVVLAAGDGERVRSLTRDRWGEPAPKQFASIDGERSLLGAALERAGQLTPRERIVTVVAARHERWWRAELAGLPSANVVVQPENRGTAAGLLLPLVSILRRDPWSVVVSLPSDHFVESEAILHRSLSEAVTAVSGGTAPVVLLGVVPDDLDEGYGWIVPRRGCGSGPYRVAAFKEKPDRAMAASLQRRGALWNTFIMVAEGGHLAGLIHDTLPELWASFEESAAESFPGVTGGDGLTDLYGRIPSSDFSRDVLENAAERLWVHPVPACGWTDLGTPARLQNHLSRRCTIVVSSPAEWDRGSATR